MQDRMDKMNNTASVMKQVVVLVGAGSIGQAIVRRVAAGKHVVLADYSLEHAQQAATTLVNAGFECSTIQCDLGSKDDILRLVDFATGKGEVTNVINAAGVSPSQAPVEEILRVDLYGTSVLLEEFGKVIAPGGSGVVVSSQSGHRLPDLDMIVHIAYEGVGHLRDMHQTAFAARQQHKCAELRDAGDLAFQHRAH